MSDARQPGLDLLYSWAAILPSFSFSRVKTLNKTNMVASRYMNRKESSLPVNLRHPKTSLLKLPIDPIDHFEVVRGTGTVLC